ncbi:MAG: NAD(P)/FAD-dependent oxidoreductase [Deltaproteobacteria bacterium]|nr:NAD(P)/FAD-dependent oxidoreductase [Deltaproteobacteria bacterium]MBW2143559.1 NAD(P)/FAD-dependent oxidoreductase [Deltaproteobacteria bacterium]
MADYDAIIVGAGHNGLAAAAVLAKEGLKVLVLEKQRYVGGMAGTTEYFKGFKHNVGAWALMVSTRSINKALELEEHGFEVIDPPISFCTFGEPGDTPYIYYNDPARLEKHLREDHGDDAAQALEGLYGISRTFGMAIGALRFKLPKSLGAVIDGMPSLKDRDVMRRCLFGSAVDLISEFFPDRTKHKSIQASLAAMAVDGTGVGPYSAGTAFSLGLHLAPMAFGVHFQLVKGGMGGFSEAIRQSIEEKGGEVKLLTPVKRVMVENGKAIGVELKSGEKISARVVLSNLDAYSTFFRLVGDHNLPADFTGMVRRIKYTNPYLEIHVTLKELPEFVGDLAFANESNIRWSMSYIPSLDNLEQCYDACKWGRVPKVPYSAYYIPSLLDDSFAPPGYHSATFFSQFFPINAPREQHKQLKEEMADRVIDQMNRFAPNLKDAIVDKVVFTPLHYEKMFGITGGDYSHGLMQPDQLLDSRPVMGWSEYKTPVENLYLCGSACHPGPGVTAVPGYNSAREVLKTWEK